MKKESKNRFCFKKARWIIAAAAALSLYPGSVFAEENIEVENTAAELSVEESATPVPEKNRNNRNIRTTAAGATDKKGTGRNNGNNGSNRREESAGNSRNTCVHRNS